jgi:SAM-dependent methyltransferase
MEASTRNNLTSSVKLLYHQREACDEGATVWDQNRTTTMMAHFTHLIKERVNPGALILDADADVRHLPLADNTFDLVAGTWVIEFLDNPQAVVQEFMRVVKPGGFVIYAFCGLFVVCQKDGQEGA